MQRQLCTNAGVHGEGFRGDSAVDEVLTSQFQSRRSPPRPALLHTQQGNFLWGPGP